MPQNLTESKELALKLGISESKLTELGQQARYQYSKVPSDKFCQLCKIRVIKFLESEIFKSFRILNDNPFNLCLTCHKLAIELIDSIKLIGLTSDERRRELMDGIGRILSNGRRARYR